MQHGLKMFSLKETGFDFRLDFFIYVLLGVIHHSGKSMKKLHGKENEAAVKEVWNKLNDQVLDYVLNLLKKFFLHLIVQILLKHQPLQLS